ncbi:hypothetical protein [Nocardia implantans]|uniref:Uncharacterized protein n=1 Tax=Nocardia implantans TaxID=3108168 RepID=A0ABU6AUY0_9NOCA|nr:MULTISPECIES: hypothetical protein [unclassified Nocardia]MBF6192541.1 hypothetical protein [Nocardia beijingensis]MEA3527554.1 hypothetical protein [Nocardia sp. CDC192]MEB3511262.1 hypothetical protein [Nocardia sp. CDC186]
MRVYAAPFPEAPSSAGALARRPGSAAAFWSSILSGTTDSLPGEPGGFEPTRETGR